MGSRQGSELRGGGRHGLDLQCGSAQPPPHPEVPPRGGPRASHGPCGREVGIPARSHRIRRGARGRRLQLRQYVPVPATASAKCFSASRRARRARSRNSGRHPLPGRGHTSRPGRRLLHPSRPLWRVLRALRAPTPSPPGSHRGPPCGGELGRRRPRRAGNPGLVLPIWPDPGHARSPSAPAHDGGPPLAGAGGGRAPPGRNGEPTATALSHASALEDGRRGASGLRALPPLHAERSGRPFGRGRNDLAPPRRACAPVSGRGVPGVRYGHLDRARLRRRTSLSRVSPGTEPARHGLRSEIWTISLDDFRFVRWGVEGASPESDLDPGQPDDSLARERA
jgi:hypothetical protein